MTSSDLLGRRAVLYPGFTLEFRSASIFFDAVICTPSLSFVFTGKYLRGCLSFCPLVRAQLSPVKTEALPTTEALSETETPML